MALTGKIMDFFADKAMTTPAFPRTKVKAVSDDNNVGLDALLNAKVATTEDGMTALFASGKTVLSSNQYGDTLPAAGTVGRVFFKRVTD